LAVTHLQVGHDGLLRDLVRFFWGLAATQFPEPKMAHLEGGALLILNELCLVVRLQAPQGYVRRVETEEQCKAPRVEVIEHLPVEGVIILLNVEVVGICELDRAVEISAVLCVHCIL
jgi:hypothetical protein